MVIDDERLNHPSMAYYRETYRDSQRLASGEPKLNGLTIVVYCEQGYGDIIQMVRYIPALKKRGAEVILHCPVALHRLFEQLGVKLADKEQPPPEHDLHALSMSLPFLLGMPVVPTKYLAANGAEDIEVDSVKIGVAWEGSPTNPDAATRNCPAKHFMRLRGQLVLLQPQLTDFGLVAGAEQMDLLGADLDDFYDTARLIEAVDYVVAVDTAVLHLAGAMGKRAYGLLSSNACARWGVAKWYDSVTLVRQPSPGDWAGTFDLMEHVL